jgi:hypothetical protein
MLLQSAAWYLPGVPWVIVDQTSQQYAASMAKAAGIKAIVLRPGFDKGIGYCRNAYLAKIETPLFLNLDEDFILPDADTVRKLAEPVRDGTYDICAGTAGDREIWCDRFSVEGGRLVQTPIPPIDEFTECDITHAFFVADTARVRMAGGWDSKQMGWDHIPFFITAKNANLRVAYRRGCPVIHHRVTPKPYKHILKRRARMQRRWLDARGLTGWTRR